MVIYKQADCEDTTGNRPLKLERYMIEHSQDWLAFAREKLGNEIKICDLVLVEVCELTENWANAIHRQLIALFR